MKTPLPIVIGLCLFSIVLSAIVILFFWQTVIKPVYWDHHIDLNDEGLVHLCVNSSTATVERRIDTAISFEIFSAKEDVAIYLSAGDQQVFPGTTDEGLKFNFTDFRVIVQDGQYQIQVVKLDPDPEKMIFTLPRCFTFEASK